MLEKICEHCNTKFFLLKAGKKELKRRFCGPICSRRWAANNRSETWKQKASLAKQGKNNPMFGKESSRKGKTYEEIYGVEKARELKENLRLKTSR